MKKIKILTFSTLYPNQIKKNHGIFVETRLRYLLKNGKVESRVIAPVAWFPFKSSFFGGYANNAKIPQSDKRHGIKILYPRFPLLPKVGMTLAPFFIAIFSYFKFKIIMKEYDFDIIDAHYFYPDGVAAAMLGKWLDKPVTITARGTDLNLIPQYFLPRKMIQWAANQADGLITVCHALKDVLIQLGIDDSKIQALRNGVNLELFYPSNDRKQLRNKLNISGKTILSVGYLVERKGHALVIRALLDCPDVTLYIVGDGEDEDKLRSLVKQLNLSTRVVFLGSLAQEQLSNYYAAVDMLVLASSREGWANVLLEAMACGTPVVATNVWGTPEVVTEPEAGVLIERNEKDIARGIKTLFSRYPNRDLTRKYAENFSWQETTKGQEELFSNILKEKDKR